MSDHVGTPGHMSPQNESGKRYSGLLEDVFALGVTMFSLVFGKLPWARATAKDVMFGHFLAESTEKFWSTHGIKREEHTGFKRLFEQMCCPDWK